MKDAADEQFSLFFWSAEFLFFYHLHLVFLQCFDAVVWVAGRASDL